VWRIDNQAGGKPVIVCWTGATRPTLLLSQGARKPRGTPPCLTQQLLQCCQDLHASTDVNAHRSKQVLCMKPLCITMYVTRHTRPTHYQSSTQRHNSPYTSAQARSCCCGVPYHHTTQFCLALLMPCNVPYRCSKALIGPHQRG
jgi:hypothetical protein